MSVLRYFRIRTNIFSYKHEIDWSPNIFLCDCNFDIVIPIKCICKLTRRRISFSRKRTVVEIKRRQVLFQLWYIDVLQNINTTETLIKTVKFASKWSKAVTKSLHLLPTREPWTGLRTKNMHTLSYTQLHSQGGTKRAQVRCDRSQKPPKSGLNSLSPCSVVIYLHSG